MSDERIRAKGTVTEGRAEIPTRIRHELDIDDGDRLRWVLKPDGSICVEVLSQQTETFSEFEGYDGEEPPT